MEISKYGSDIIPGIIGAEIVMALSYRLRILGVTITGPSPVHGDIISVITNCSITSRRLNKKHKYIDYHKVREVLDSGVLFLYHM